METPIPKKKHAPEQTKSICDVDRVKGTSRFALHPPPSPPLSASGVRILGGERVPIGGVSPGGRTQRIPAYAKVAGRESYGARDGAAQQRPGDGVLHLPEQQGRGAKRIMYPPPAPPPVPPLAPLRVRKNAGEELHVPVRRSQCVFSPPAPTPRMIAFEAAPRVCFLGAEGTEVVALGTTTSVGKGLPPTATRGEEG